MTWGAIGGAAVSVVGGALMSDGGGGGGGGAGSSSQSRDPWAPAAPWLMSNLVSGQNLQNAYAAQPFSAMQNTAYNNQANQSAYMRALVPDLLGQVSGQTLGFDRSKPNARPNAFNFAGEGTMKGLLAQMANGQNNGSLMQNTPQVQPPEEPKFAQQNGLVSGMNMSNFDGKNMYGSGSYGTFKYGMPMPQPGTQQYRDMSAYFANGGSDPNNYYGRASTNPYVDPKANPLAYMWTSGIGGYGGAPGEGEGPSSGAPGGAASAGPGGTF